MLNSELLDKIYELLGDDFDGSVGLRGDVQKYEVGQELYPSRYWEDGVETGEVLDGTSALIISADWRYDSRDTIKSNLSKYGPLVSQYGDNIYVIVGNIAQGGDDIGEIIIPDAKVLMIVG